MESFSNTLKHISELTKEIQDLVTESPELCPQCLATEYMDRNATILTKELYAASKEKPVEAFQAIKFILAQHAALDVVLSETLQTFINLHEEELTNGSRDLNGNKIA